MGYGTLTSPTARIQVPQWVVWRCPKCNRILARTMLTKGSQVEVKCKHCNQMIAIMEAA